MHTAKCGDTVFLLFIMSVQIAFAFDLLLSDPVRLIPMWFRQPDAPTVEPDTRYALQLSPSALPIILPKALDIANSCSCGNGLDNCDLTDDLEIHLAGLCGNGNDTLPRQVGSVADCGGNMLGLQ